jgi:NAD(P)-dependent dehydrogenase (short-subunit alcohol dehydrogenase family)
MKTLKGKVAISTRAAGKKGLGHAVALRPAGEGANVVITAKITGTPSLFPGDEGWAVWMPKRMK